MVLSPTYLRYKIHQTLTVRKNIKKPAKLMGWTVGSQYSCVQHPLWLPSGKAAVVMRSTKIRLQGYHNGRPCRIILWEENINAFWEYIKQNNGNQLHSALWRAVSNRENPLGNEERTTSGTKVTKVLSS